jgi:hypothetical protein
MVAVLCTGMCKAVTAQGCELTWPSGATSIICLGSRAQHQAINQGDARVCGWGVLQCGWRLTVRRHLPLVSGCCASLLLLSHHLQQAGSTKASGSEGRAGVRCRPPRPPASADAQQVTQSDRGWSIWSFLFYSKVQGAGLGDKDARRVWCLLGGLGFGGCLVLCVQRAGGRGKADHMCKHL